MLVACVGLLAQHGLSQCELDGDNEVLAEDVAAQDYYGGTLGVSGVHALIGAPNDDDHGGNAGLVYSFTFETGWVEDATPIAPSDFADDLRFGWGLAIDGLTAVIGAPRWTDGAGNRLGAVYIFEYGTAWTQTKRLTASNGAAGDELGGGTQEGALSVAIDGDLVVAGAPLRNSSAGAAYLFERDDGGDDNWGEIAKLTPDDNDADDKFGWAVAISGDFALVGAPFDDSPESSDTGAAYIFDANLSGDPWGQRVKLVDVNASGGDEFGNAVAISGDIAIVGAREEDQAGVGAGAVYVFDRNEGGSDNWGQVEKLLGSDLGTDSSFGYSVAFDGERLIVGAREVDLQPETNAGASYLFRFDGTSNWCELGKITDSNGLTDDEFGHAVAIDRDVVFIGALNDDAAGNAAGMAFEFDGFMCDGDVTIDCVVDVDDLIEVVLNWEAAPGAPRTLMETGRLTSMISSPWCWLGAIAHAPSISRTRTASRP